MHFDSVEYVVLLAVTFAVFHLGLRGLRPLVLVAASVVFYASWNAPFVLLIVASAVVDYTAGRRIAAATASGRRRAWLLASLCTNLGILGWFKYAGFFVDTVRELLDLGAPGALDIVLPIGISFYTFQTMSYTIDVYRGRLEPSSRPVEFFLYVCFFPQLIAGPIERASHLIPQLHALERFRLARSDVFVGLHLIIWGLFKKMAISDNLALIVDAPYAAPGEHGGAALLVATYAFAFQIFFDFSAYSDIARGSARLFGVRLVRNFRLPYLAQGPSDFWRRWHVSLSEWIRDYLYISLGGSRGRLHRTLFNLALTMALAGLWHGAAWHFCLWGIFHGVLLVVWRLAAPAVGSLTRSLPDRFASVLRVVLMFHLVCLGWILFRAATVADALTIMERIADWAGTGVAPTVAEARILIVFLLFWCIMGIQERHDLLRRVFGTPMGWGLGTAAALVAIALFAPETSAPFIYFQF